MSIDPNRPSAAINETSPPSSATDTAPATAPVSKDVTPQRADAAALTRAVEAGERHASSTSRFGRRSSQPPLGGVRASALLTGQSLEDPKVTRAAALARAVVDAKTPLDALRVVVAEYPEMAWLTGSVHATPERGGGLGDKSYAAQLFGKDAIEFDRSAVGIHTLLWARAGDREAFVACQPDAAKVSLESFARMQKLTLAILTEAGALAGANAANAEAVGLDAVIAYTVLNDLGKVKSVVDQINEQLQKAGESAEIDHDKILRIALERHPEMSPSFSRLPKPLQQLFIASLAADFNFGQFLQAENVPASLNGLGGMSKQALDFYMLHVLFDIAGAAGHVRHDGSVVMTEATFAGFEAGWDAVRRLATGATPVAVYDAFLQMKADALGLDMSTPTGRAVTRVACMMRLSAPDEAQTLQRTFVSLPANERAILTRELNRSGVDDGFATLLYYAPATFANAKKALTEVGDPTPFESSTKIGLKAFARAFQQARIALKGRKGDGIYSLNVADLAAMAGKAPRDLDNITFTIEKIGNDAKLVLKPKSDIDPAAYPKLALADLPGRRIVPVGIGGGSDVIQAAIVGKLLKNSGKDVPAVVSVRTAVTGSQGAAGAIGEERTVQNADEILPGIFRITPQSTGSGRFVENVPAGEVPVYLVIDRIDGTLTARLDALMKRIGNVDTAIAVDTGGDALYPSDATAETARATPDQDLRVLSAMAGLSIKVISAEVATGIDSPENASEVLVKANARFFMPSAADTAMINEVYTAWDFTGDNPTRYGKTPLGWQAALAGARGYTSIPLPTSVVTDEKNPWDPFVALGPATAGVFFMEADQHLAAIGVST